MKLRDVIKYALYIFGLTGTVLLLGAGRTISNESIENDNTKNNPVITDGQIAKRPNLLFIMSDQHRGDFLSIAGNTVISTPNIDGIGNAGVYFESAYTPVPVCVPARVCILSGRTMHHTGIYSNSQFQNASKEKGQFSMESFDEILSSLGYYSEYIGKWHAPVYRASIYEYQPFNEQKNGSYTAGGDLDALKEYIDKYAPRREVDKGELMDEGTYNRPYRPDPMDSNYDIVKNGGKDNTVNEVTENKNKKSKIKGSFGQIMTPSGISKNAFVADETIEALKRAKKEGRPFNITCSFSQPHPPLLIPKPYYGMFKTEDMEIPPSINDNLENSPYKSHFKADSPFRDTTKIPFMISDYYGAVKEVDDLIGRILSELDEIGEAENTLVLYISDHGEMLGAHGLNGKAVFYEESIHVPFLMKFPKGIRPGTVIKSPVNTMDLYSTILDYLGAGKYESDGISLRNIIESEPDDISDKYTVVEWNTTPDFCVRTKDWKLIYSKTVGTIDALYNLKNDPYEMNNLIGNNPERMKYKEQVGKMKSYLLEYLTKTGNPDIDKIRNKPLVSIPSAVEKTVKKQHSKNKIQ